MWLLVMIAGVAARPSIGRLWVRSLLVVGPAVFLAIGFAGFVLADGFLSYPPAYAKPLIILAEASLDTLDRRDTRPADGRPTWERRQ